jgi:hypothetical protein
MVHGPTTMTLLDSHTPSPITMSRPTLGTAFWRSAPNFEKSCVPVSSDTL